MLFTQDKPYNRYCPVKWEFIKENLKGETATDIGSAEGYYVIKMADMMSQVYSYEGSEAMYTAQDKLVKDIANVKLYKRPATPTTKMKPVDNMLILSVLHWFEEPDQFLEKAAEVAEQLFVELPDLDCKSSWNQSYLRRIKSDYGDIKSYLESVTGKKVYAEKENMAKHVRTKRVVYLLK
jgi:hypothetical protein